MSAGLRMLTRPLCGAADRISHLALIAPGDRVWTPTGREATVVTVHLNRNPGEATVQWDDGESADFRIAALRRMPLSRNS